MTTAPETAVESVLEPDRQPHLTDQGLEPMFSDKALIVMAIYNNRRIQATQIVSWIQKTFRNPRYTDSGYLGIIENILSRDLDFLRSRRDNVVRWSLSWSVTRALGQMRTSDRKRFVPERHIKRHANKLKSRAALDPALPISKNSSGEQQLPASEDYDEAIESETTGTSGSDSRSDDTVMMRKLKRLMRPVARRGTCSVGPSSRNSSHGNLKTIETLPATTLKYKREPDEVPASASDGSSTGLANTAHSAHFANLSFTQDFQHQPDYCFGQYNGFRAQQQPPNLFSQTKDVLNHTFLQSANGGDNSYASNQPAQPSNHLSSDANNKDRKGRIARPNINLYSSLIEHKARSMPGDGTGTHEKVDSDWRAKNLYLIEDDNPFAPRNDDEDPLVPFKEEFGLSLQQERGKDSQRSTTGEEDGCSTQEQSGRRGHTAELDGSKKASVGGPEDHEHLISSALSESPPPETPDRHNEDADVLHFHDAEFPSSRIDSIDTLSAQIGNKNGSLNFARKYPEIAEYKDQDYRDQSFSFEFTSRRPWIDDLSNRPLEMEKNMYSQLEATEETSGLGSLESGEGHNYIEDVQAASRLDATLLDESRQIHKVYRLTLVAFVLIPLSFTASFLGMKASEEGSGPFLWIYVPIVLCLSVWTYAAWDAQLGNLLQDLGGRAQKSQLVLLLKISAQGALVAEIMLFRMLKELFLDTFTGFKRQYLEAPVPLGMKRVCWQCRCGQTIHDDYVELKPALTHSPAGKDNPHFGPLPTTERDHGSDEGLEREHGGDLVETGLVTSSQQSGKDYNQQPAPTGAGYALGSIGKSLKNILMGFSEAGSLPTHNPGSSVAKSAALSIPRIPDHLEFLLLCIPFKSHANKLMNIDTTTPPSSDIAFFRLLRQTYAKNRGRFRNLFSIRSLSEIRFVQFEVFRNDLADVRRFDCIPPEAQKDNYLYQPMPAEFEPPIGKNQMRHLYDHPDHADDLPVCYSRVPRKLRERLAAAPGIGRSEGWGICFIEGVSWPRVCALGLVGVLASTIFGIAWTVVQKDIQGGFGVASYMLGVLVLSLGALQGAFEM